MDLEANCATGRLSADQTARVLLFGERTCEQAYAKKIGISAICGFRQNTPSEFFFMWVRFETASLLLNASAPVNCAELLHLRKIERIKCDDAIVIISIIRNI